MQTTSPNLQQEAANRKSAAAGLLRWMNEEITQAPEPYIRSLDEDLAICLCRSALDKTVRTGEKISAAVLFSVDGNRLNHLHLAVVHDASDVDGRKNASENTVRASKFLNLEHKLIDNQLVQYTVTPDTARIGTQSRHDRGNAAHHLLAMMDEMRNGNHDEIARRAERDVMREPMMMAYAAALNEVARTGDLMPPELTLAMDNNASAKLRQSVNERLRDPKGESTRHFSTQHAAYRKLASLARSNNLIDGIATQQQHSRG